MNNREFYEEYLKKINKLLDNKVRSKCYTGATLEIIETRGLPIKYSHGDSENNNALVFELIYKEDKEYFSSHINSNSEKIKHCIIKHAYQLDEENTRDMFYDNFLETIFRTLHMMRDLDGEFINSYSIGRLIRSGIK